MFDMTYYLLDSLLSQAWYVLVGIVKHIKFARSSQFRATSLPLICNGCLLTATTSPEQRMTLTWRFLCTTNMCCAWCVIQFMLR